MSDPAQEEIADEPIEAHLAALGIMQPFPEDALRACVSRIDEARRPLRALLDRAAAGKSLSKEEWLRFFRGLHVLAAVRDEDSFASLLRLMRRPADEVDDLLGDAIYLSVPRFVISLFDGDAEALFSVVSDPTTHELVRGAALDAASYLTWQRRLARDDMRRFLLALDEDRRGEDEAPVWYSWMQAVALLDFGDLAPMVERAWKAGRIDRSIQDWSDFRTDLARAHTAFDDERRFENLSVGPIEDVVAELVWTRHWTDDGDEAISTGDTRRDAAWDPSTPAINPFRNVGRNDPCSCGSGKKAKKCCLASA